MILNSGRHTQPDPQSCRVRSLGRRRGGAQFFFSSSVADVALWLGPYMSISNKNLICTRTQKVRKCRQITTKQTKHTHTQARRPANPPARPDLRFVKRNSNQTQERGKSPNKNTHKKICQKTQWSDHCVTLKNMKRGGAQKQTTHQGTKTKVSSATPNRDKTIHCQRKHRKSIPPTMSQRNQHLTHAMLRKPATTTPKQFQTTWCFGKELATCRRG